MIKNKKEDNSKGVYEYVTSNISGLIWKVKKENKNLIDKLKKSAEKIARDKQERENVWVIYITIE